MSSIIFLSKLGFILWGVFYGICMADNLAEAITNPDKLNIFKKR